MYSFYTCLVYFYQKRSNEVEHFIFSDLVFVVADENYVDQIKLVGWDALAMGRHVCASVSGGGGYRIYT